MERIKYILLALLLVVASNDVAGETAADEPVDTKSLIFEHIEDSYWWHLTTINERHISLYLPVIVYSKAKGLNIFMSSRLENGGNYNGFHLSGEGKIVEENPQGEEVRPIDLSLTKTALALIINSLLMIVIFLSVARWYGRHPRHSPPGGLVGAIEMFVMSVEDDIIRKSIPGDDYARYSPYLLTAFFFIFINNIMGMIPFFPGGANVTGNISITVVLAVCTMLATNLFGNKEYWKEIFWPEVPLWIKVPVPLMPLIELFGVISKPFALAIRLFANITAGHAIILALTCMIFTTVKMGVGMNAGMTVFAILLSVFMSFLEILVAYIQAYVFTLLSAVFIGLSRQTHHATPLQDSK